jgi:5-methylthioribose kinase
MSFFSQRGHQSQGPRDAMRTYLLEVVTKTWTTFRDEFANLWRTERNGILYQKSLFEDQKDTLGAEEALAHVMHDIWTEMLGFAGVEIHRRILGLAHNADFEEIADVKTRATCEARALKLGRHLAVNRNRITSLAEVNAMARLLDDGIVS